MRLGARQRHAIPNDNDSAQAAKLAVHRERKHGWPATFIPFHVFLGDAWPTGYPLIQKHCVGLLPPPSANLSSLAADPTTARLVDTKM